MGKLDQRNAEVVAAHTSLSDAIRHLDMATTHVDDELDRHWIAGIMRQLCEARQPLAADIDIQA
jgi:hypothetical protein